MTNELRPKLVILEQGDTSFGAYVPDLPGCIAVGDTKDEALQLIREVIELHLESLRENGESVPAPHSFVEGPKVGGQIPTWLRRGSR